MPCPPTPETYKAPEKESVKVKDTSPIDNYTLKQYIKKNFSVPENTTIDPRHLWDNFYRINYWVSIVSKESLCTDNKIVESVFVRIEKVDDGIVHELIK
jgi:hypothetical protein